MKRWLWKDFLGAPRWTWFLPGGALGWHLGVIVGKRRADL